MNIAQESSLNQATKQGNNAIPVMSRWFGSWQISLNRRPFSQDELSHHYDDYANRWNRILEKLDYPAKYERLFDSILNKLDFVNDGKPLKILDCGVGTGELSSAFIRLWQKPVDLYALDISPSMLQQAQKSLQNRDVNLQLKLGDAQTLPYDDNMFDLSMTAHMLEHFADPKTAIQEMIRVTRPGSYVLACISKRSLLGRYIQVKWRTHLFSLSEAENWFTECGLENVSSLPIGEKGAFNELSIAVLGTKNY